MPMTDGSRKLMEVGSDGRRHRLRTISHDGNPRRFVRLERREDGEWRSVGRAELHPTLGADPTGDLATEGVILEWAGAWSHRRNHQHRLVVEWSDTTLVVRHEHATTDPYDETDVPEWDLEEGYRITADAVERLDDQSRGEWGDDSGAGEGDCLTCGGVVMCEATCPECGAEGPRRGEYDV